MAFLLVAILLRLQHSLSMPGRAADSLGQMNS